MAKRKAARGKKKAKVGRKAAPARRSVKRSSPKGRARTAKKAISKSRKPGGTRSAGPARKARKTKMKARPRAAAGPARAAKRRSAASETALVHGKAPRLDRARRTLDDDVPTPPSSLDMNRRGTAARTGRAEIAERRLQDAGMTPAITGGDVDVNVENAYFTGDEAPGGDNPTPDQDVVDDIGKAIGVEYQDNEELRASDKVTARDKHRWELDPASSEDYKDRK
jgi:hypothetical protein